MENVIPLFRKQAEAKVKHNDRVRVFADRLDGLYEAAQKIMDDMDAALPDDVMVGDMSKERFFGFFEGMLDSIDDTWIRFSPKFDELDPEKAG